LKPLLDRPRLLLILTALFWAGNVIVGRAVVGTVPPLTLACLRWMLATLLLLPVAWPYLRTEWRAIMKNLRLLIFLGLLGPGCYNSLNYFALVSTEALNNLVLNAAGPMVIALAAWILASDRPNTAQLAGMAAGFSGVLLIVTRGGLSSLAALNFNPGDILILASILTWSVYTVYVRTRPPISWQSYSFAIYAVAAVLNFPLAAAEHLQGYDLTLNWAAVAAIGFTAIFPSLISYVFYNRAVELLGPAEAGLYLFLVPVFGAILATALLGETLHLFHALGFALIIAGVLIGGRSAVAAKEAGRTAPLAVQTYGVLSHFRRTLGRGSSRRR
jgi:drug/metabolite transporter (DMT)-like permease